MKSQKQNKLENIVEYQILTYSYKMMLQTRYYFKRIFNTERISKSPFSLHRKRSPNEMNKIKINCDGCFDVQGDVAKGHTGS